MTKSPKLHMFQPLEDRQIPVSWDDLEPTGKTAQIFRLKTDGTEGVKIHKSDVDRERLRSGNALIEWLSEDRVPTEHKPGFEALIEVWKS